MKIEYDPHARKQMTKRKVSDAQVEAVFANPKVTPAAAGRYRSEGKFGTRTLAVIWSPRPKYKKYVWTTFWVGEPDPK